MKNSKRKKVVNVKVTFTIPVQIPDEEDYDMFFDIEENHCPGTGIVGAAIAEHIRNFKEQDKCWACALGGENKIIIERSSP